MRCARCVSACRVWGSVDRRSRNKFRRVVKSTKFAIAGAKRKKRNFIEICHTRFEIIASKFPMAAIRNSCPPQADSTAAGPEPTAPRGRLRRQAAPSEPDPASTRSQSASPRLLESGRRNEGACGRRVLAAGSAAGAPDKLETREAEAGMRNGRGEADLRAQRRDHEGPRARRARSGRQASATVH